MRTRQIKVFLSYSYKDTEIAERVRDELSVAGVDALSSHYSLANGDSLRSAIKADISACDFVVVLLSPDALESSWIQYELHATSDREWKQRAITVVPVKVRPCKIPDYMLSWPIVDATRDFSKGIRSLISVLRSAPLLNFDDLSPTAFEDLVFDVLRAYGFKQIKRSPLLADYGYDLTASYRTKDPFGRPEIVEWLIEIKSDHRQTDVRALRSFIGAMKLRGETVRALFVTRSQLTSPAREWLEELRRSGTLRLSVLEGTDLVNLILLKPRLVSKHFGSTSGGGHA